MIHGLHHAKTKTCHCLARFARFTKRTSLGPDLLALLPLRRLAAATLRERPVPLRRDEVALHALHLELLLPPMAGLGCGRRKCSSMGSSGVNVDFSPR